MTNNEKKSNEKWSLKKTILLIVLVVLLFASLFSCGLNVFKTTYNKVNQVNYDETTEILTDYTSFNKVDRDIKKVNDNGVVVAGQFVDTIYFNYSYTNTNDLLTDLFSNGVAISDFTIDTSLSDTSITALFYTIYNGTSNDNINVRLFVMVDNSTQMPLYFFITFNNGNGVTDLLSQIIITNIGNNDGSIIYERALIRVMDTCKTTTMYNGTTYNVGTINDKLTFFVSTTPFINDSGGGGSYTPNPQYNIVQPSISGDLVLGTMFEPMLESQTTFGELYVSYIIGQSNSVYSLNLVINLVLEGTNNYINVPISTTLNINDLSNNSYTQVIANFDSELEELNLIIEVSSNNNVIYTYDNSFPCVMNNSFTYSYQVNGFSNTQTAKQYLISYNTNQGYNNGLNIGRQEGYSNGYQVGYDEGYDDGYNYTDDNGNYRGYEQGYHDGSNNEFAKDGVKDLVNIIFNAPYNIFNGFLNFEIFGVNLFNLLSFIFTLVLVGWIIALLMKR